MEKQCFGAKCEQYSNVKPVSHISSLALLTIRKNKLCHVHVLDNGA